MNRKIVVIGSNSFSGGNFIDLLLEDPSNDVVGMSRSPEKDDLFLTYHRHVHDQYRFLQFDLNQDISRIITFLDSYKPDYIVNFAAQSEVEPSWTTPWHWFETNAVALAHLANYLKDVTYLKKYLHISSPEVYGSCQGIVKEDAPFNPSTPYAASKAAADLLLLTYFKNFRLPIVTVRTTNVYGPGQQLFKIIPRTVISIKSGQPLELHGGGRAIKSYIHIRDCSRGELSIMLNGRTGEIYHLSPDKGFAVRDIVQLICRQMNMDFNKCVHPVEERLGQDFAYVIDSAKARKEFSWTPQITLDQGVQEVIDWVEKNWSRIKIQPLEYIHRH